MERNRLDRAAIMNTAAVIAEEATLENLTLKELADRLSVKTPSLYNHIGGLKDVYEGIAALGMKRLGRLLGNVAMGKSNDEAVFAIAREYRKFAKENPEVYKAILKSPDMGGSEIKEAENMVVQILQIVLEPYHLGEEETFHIIRALRSAIHGFVSLEEAGFFRAAVDTEESYDKTISLLLKSISNTEEAGESGIIELSGEFYL